jgi:hypothetical protein
MQVAAAVAATAYMELAETAVPQLIPQQAQTVVLARATEPVAAVQVVHKESDAPLALAVLGLAATSLLRSLYKHETLGFN